MKINLQEILQLAEQNNYGIAAFNTPTFENVVAAINTAEKYKVPIIIQHAQVHEDVMPLSMIGPAMVALAEKASVPICVHVDHGEDINHIEEGLELGFSSVMYDGSALSYEDNVKNTREVVALAKRFNAGVEAEIGVMGGEEGGKVVAESVYTDVALAEQFVKDTQIDALAASFGTVHGFYLAKPNLDFDRIKDIEKATKVPVVMHGGSGLSTEEYKEAIKNGVRKINYYSYAAKSGLDEAKKTIENDNPSLYHEVSVKVIKAMEENYAKFVEVLYNK